MNEAAKFRYRSGNLFNVGGLTIRAPCSAVWTRRIISFSKRRSILCSHTRNKGRRQNNTKIIWIGMPYFIWQPFLHFYRKIYTTGISILVFVLEFCCCYLPTHMTLASGGGLRSSRVWSTYSVHLASRAVSPRGVCPQIQG